MTIAGVTAAQLLAAAPGGDPKIIAATALALILSSSCFASVVVLTPGVGAGAFDNSPVINRAMFGAPMATVTSAWYNTAGFTITTPDASSYVVGNTYIFDGFSGPLAPMKGSFVAGRIGTTYVVFYTAAMGGSQSTTSVGVGAVFSYSPTEVDLPAGTFHIAGPVADLPGSCLVGTSQTVLDGDMDFAPSATGIVNVSATTGNQRPCVRGVNIVEHTPPDILAKPSVATPANSASIVVMTPAAGAIGAGMYVTATSGAIKSANGSAPTTVISVVPNGATTTVNLSLPTTAALGVNDTLYFAQPRSGFAPLGSCNTATPGGAPCKYPWAVYAPGVGQIDLDRVFLSNVWNGIYLRGSTFHLGYIQVGAYNIGLDVDQSYNFPQVDDYEFWGFGMGDASHNAILNNYYDGSVVAANIGETDGAHFGAIQSWGGRINLTPTFSWADFGSIMLDGNNANLYVQNCQWAQIGRMYSTKGGATNDTALVMSPSNSGCKVQVDNYYAFFSRPDIPAISVSNGTLAIHGGSFWGGQIGTASSAIKQTGGGLMLHGMNLTCGGQSSGYVYLNQTGGWIDFDGNTFAGCSASPGGKALSLTDNSLNIVSKSNLWNGWGFTPPGPLGTY